MHHHPTHQSSKKLHPPSQQETLYNKPSKQHATIKPL